LKEKRCSTSLSRDLWLSRAISYKFTSKLAEVRTTQIYKLYDHHAIRELSPILGINLGFQNFIGFLLVGNSLR